MSESMPLMYPPLTRSVPVSEVALDGDTLEALFVPWDKPITVYGEEPEPFQEGFRSTAFDVQLDRAPETIRSVSLKPAHGSTETFGHTRQVTVTEPGLHGVIRVLPSRRDDVRAMVEDGIDSVSIEFHPLQKNPRRGEIRWRDRAFLTGIVLTSQPAYADAKVLAMRAEQLAAKAEADRQRRMADLDRELAELRAGGERWHTNA